MRVVIDMQGAQASNRYRGIGRYTMSFAQALVRNRGEHEIILALNGLFPETIEPIRAGFDDALPQENIRVWHAPGPVAFTDNANKWRRQSAELIREAFLASLRPDIVHIGSLFEGLCDDAVTSVGLLSRTIPTAVTLFDLIPYVHRSLYQENHRSWTWYLEKIEFLRRADLWLAISESSRQEGIKHLELPDEWVVNVSTDADAYFQRIKIPSEVECSVRTRYGLDRPFVMYTSGIDRRKNIEGLIRAFSKLPKEMSKGYQLAIVCSLEPGNKQMLEQLAEKHHLRKDALVLTGFVPEEDLRTLYNLCALFVFPSWHEGFGLPVLEAMRCGAPVIGANTSSLPEVIGWDEALFDPYSEDAMAKKITLALSDEQFREELINNSKRQSAKFSWDETAKRAIAAMKRLRSIRQRAPSGTVIKKPRPKLAYVSPLPPERSGIADYSAILLPELARHYDIEAIISQETIDDQLVDANCPVRSAPWFTAHADHYDRVLYHFGNSTYHKHMFALLKAVPGVVVLHDFFLSGVLANMEAHGYEPGLWTQELYSAHGYKALHERFHASDTRDVVWKYPCSLSVIQASLGLIVHSPHSLRLAEQFYGGEVADWAVIPLLRDSHINTDRTNARKALGLDANDFLVCAFGMVGPIKLNHRLLNAWLKSSLGANKACSLVFVGENHSDDYGQELLAAIHKAKAVGGIRITGWVDRDVWHQYLAAADVAVQLRTLTRGETSAAVLECMNYGLATIVNANGSMAELDAGATWKLPDEFSDEELINAIETLWQDKVRRQQLGEAARKIIVEQHNPQECAYLYYKAIENFYCAAAESLPALPAAISRIPGCSPEDTNLTKLADAIARNFPPRNRPRQLLIDISELIQRDVRTGIQRVVRSILMELLQHPPDGYRIEPVYATVYQPYRYSRSFISKLFGIPENILEEEAIEYGPGDIFLGLDLQPQIVTLQRAFYQTLRRQGVQVKFVVYDLLPVLMPHFFLPGAADLFTRWLQVVTESDGALCISKSVAKELRGWIDKNGPKRKCPFRIDWFHLGADVDNAAPSKGLPTDAAIMLQQIGGRKSFLMVGTLEPRKGHAQVLDAFEQLWQKGLNVNLVIVGKHGWMIDQLVERLRAHPERNKRLFWLEGISDEYLEKVYTVSACLIVSSYGEGFGLPLIEAVKHNLPIIARDIPVFREVAGENAFYFKGATTESVADAVRKWLELYYNGEHPKPNLLSCLSWKESTRMLLELLLR